MGFEDNFNQIPVDRPSESPYDKTGARPKTSVIQSQPCAHSLSSGSVEFDHFNEEDFVSKPSFVPVLWNGSTRKDVNNMLDAPADDDEEEDVQEEPSGRVESFDNEDDQIVDDLADKFAAFEARFPANPVDGFGDSFADFDLTSNAIAAETSHPTSNKTDTFAVDFQSAFNEKTDFDLHDSDIDDQAVKKSTSINIFSRVEDPFDDDFFQPEPTPTTPSAATQSKSHLSHQASVQVFSAKVEDPFAWVQPFDDNVQFDDNGDEFTL